VIRVERNPRGPRLFVVGRRVHECYVGLGLLLALVLGNIAHMWALSPWVGLAAVVGAWMVLKDWRDLVPSLRDTGA